MATSRIAGDIAVDFEWTPFSHGFVFWEYPNSEHLPPADEAGQREWLEGFQQAHADDPENPDSGCSVPNAGRESTFTGAAGSFVIQCRCRVSPMANGVTW